MGRQTPPPSLPSYFFLPPPPPPPAIPSLTCAVVHSPILSCWRPNPASVGDLTLHFAWGLQVETAIRDGAGKTKFETQDFRLKPVKTMFGYDSTEKVEGWSCRIFEANGRMTAMEHLKVSHPTSYLFAFCRMWKLARLHVLNRTFPRPAQVCHKALMVSMKRTKS